MKTRTALVIALCSFALVCVIPIPIRIREVLLVLIWGWVCVFILGYLKNSPIFSISLTVVYQTAAMMIPRMLAGRWHAKYDVLDTFHTGSGIFISALITSCVLYALGRLARRIMKKRKHA